MTRVHDTLARENWSTLSDPTWFAQQWAGTGHAQHVIWTIPMLPNSGGTLAQGATGQFNTHFRTLAERLIANGQANAILRIGPEFNGNWFRWTIAAPNGGADYAAYWRQIVTTMRSVPGANFSFDWCPNAGSSYTTGGGQLQADSAWPGDSYVDYVGLDVYDQSWIPNRADPAARWTGYRTMHNGLDWHRDFAAAHNKPMSFPEWGIAHRHDGYGGGDAPSFIEQMYEWIRTNNLAYHMYFEYGDDVAQYRLYNGQSPNSAQRFTELFGPTSTGAPLNQGGGTKRGRPGLPTRQRA